MEDNRIVELYWQRNQDAIVQTHAKYSGYCYTIAWNILSDAQDCEECVNDTWLGAWNAMPEHRPSHLSAFLGKITRSLAYNRAKAKYADKRGGGELALALDELEYCLSQGSSAAQAVEDAELEEMVNRFLYTLSEQDCSIFLRRYWYVEPLTKIAKRYGMELNTVKSSLFRSRKKLRHFFEKEGVFL